jgi:hypothetical protein
MFVKQLEWLCDEVEIIVAIEVGSMFVKQLEWLLMHLVTK